MTDSRDRKIILINSAEKQPPSFWGSVERASKALAVVALPLVLGIMGYLVQHRLETKRLDEAKNRLSKEYLDLATRIVQEEKLAKRKDLKKWAHDIIREFSPVPVDPNLDFTLVDYTIDYRIAGQLVNQATVRIPEGFDAFALPYGSFLFKEPGGTFYYLHRDAVGNNTVFRLEVEATMTLDEVKEFLNRTSPTEVNK